MSAATAAFDPRHGPSGSNLSEQTRQAVDVYLRATGKRLGERLFTGCRRRRYRHFGSRNMVNVYLTRPVQALACCRRITLQAETGCLATMPMQRKESNRWA
jgi:hypothetical protein